MTEKSETKLFLNTRESYGPSFQADLFEQYKLFVASAERITERREAANNYFLTVNASLLTLFGLMSTVGRKGYWAVFVSIAGILIALAWGRIIDSYRGMNSVKYKVIHELEDHMPTALFKYERHKAMSEKNKIYQPHSRLETWVPNIFVVLYIIPGFLS